jgi:3-oxoacyl-[acyl-carrier protein] reductase
VIHILKNRVALVTGASKGIGASIAKHLALAGAKVIVNYASSKADADRVVTEIVAVGGEAIAIQGDFSKPEEVAATFAKIKQAFGKVDILVNNAGIYNLLPIDQITPEDFHRHYNLNVLGLLLAIKEAVALIGPEGGSIVNIGSVNSTMGIPGSSVYAGTKGALNSITLSLSKELGPRKIRVNAINPGLIETEGTQSKGIIGSEKHQTAVKLTPLGRIGQPDDIGRIAVFLASDDSYWLTGQITTAAGGMTI